MEKKESEYTGFPGDCSQKQLQVLEQFKKIVYEEMQLTDPPYDEAYLLRFLRARKFDIEKAKKMFSDFIQWRKDNNIEDIDCYQYIELSEVIKVYPHGYHKTCKEGRPIYIERIGELNLDKLFTITSAERLVKYYIQSYENLIHNIYPECTLAHGSKVQQSFTILDLKGAGMSLASKKVYNFIQLASKIGQDYYPEILGKMYIVNAPFLFSGVWAVIKPWLDEKTKGKIKILGSSYQKELLQCIDAENLPDFLGGKSKDKLEDCIGPWNPTGGKHFFGPNKNVYIDRNAKNDFEWFSNYKKSGEYDKIQNQLSANKNKTYVFKSEDKITSDEVVPEKQ